MIIGKKLKILFLDIDGVLNSERNIAAYKDWPRPDDNEEQLDPIAIGMIRRLCSDLDVVIVMHSTWRVYVDPVAWGKKWDLPVIGATDAGHKPRSISGFLYSNKDLCETYAIIDDDNMQDDDHQVWTRIENGMQLIHYKVLHHMFGGISVNLDLYQPHELSHVFRGKVDILYPYEEDLVDK